MFDDYTKKVLYLVAAIGLIVGGPTLFLNILKLIGVERLILREMMAAFAEVASLSPAVIESAFVVMTTLGVGMALWAAWLKLRQFL